MHPQEYLDQNNLWNLEQLKAHAQNNLVWVKTSERFPDLVLLHYADECTYDNKWSEFAMMSRGLLLDMANKKVLAYPFRKFFNLGQMPETTYNSLLSFGSFQTSEKLDGSMCILYRVPSTGEYRITTKGSLESEHGEYATSILPEILKQPKWVEDYTLMFELVTKRFQIVIDYAKQGYKEGLYLIGAREKATGRLLPYVEIQRLAAELELPTFVIHYFNSLDQLIDDCKDLPVTKEGFVLRFENDLLVKVKGNAYLEMHRFISHLSDRNILEAVANNTAESLASVCPEEYKDEVVNKIIYFKKRLEEIIKICYAYYTEAPKEDRKTYAAWVNLNVESYLRGFVFQLMDGKELNNKQIYKVIERIDKIDGKTRI